MIDRSCLDHLSAALAFAVLAGGTAAIGSELLAGRHAVAPALQVVQLERVVITGRPVSASAPFASADRIQPATRGFQ